MNSVWTQTAKAPAFPQLKNDIKTDVLIIGGGMAGILCAYKLQQAGIDSVLLEAGQIGGGITKNTTAKVTSQHGLFYQKLVNGAGPQKAKLYIDANQQALEQYRNLCQNIDCDFEEKEAYVYTLDNKKKIQEEYRALSEAGIPCRLVKALPLPFSVAGAIQFPRQAQFHPLKFLYAIARELHLYENTQVQELTKLTAGYTAQTAGGSVAAKKIIVATHFPFLNKHGSYYLKMYQHRSYVIALEKAPLVNGMYVDEEKKGMSFRSYQNLLFVGGGGHRTGKSGGGWAELEAFSKKYFPQAEIKHRWATQDCMTLDGVPYIGNYSANTPDLYVATGFNKWGMTSSMVAANILTDQIQEKANPYSAVFDPSRSMVKAQLIANSWEAALGWITPTGKRCPHLGCALKWNPAEHSWDCPCHGSRFTQKGKLIDNPSTGDLK